MPPCGGCRRQRHPLDRRRRRRGTARTLRPKADALQSLRARPGAAALAGRDRARLGGAAGRPRRSRAVALRRHRSRRRATIVQVTNLGLSVKDSPPNTLVFVTRLDDGAAGRGRDASPSATSTTRSCWTRHHRRARPRARARHRPARPRRAGGSSASSSPPRRTATSPTSAATGTRASSPGRSACSFDLEEAKPLLRGSVFTDRGVYQLGEEVHFKAILRSDTAKGIALLPAGTAVEVVLRDSQGEEMDKRTVALSEWSSADWTFALPADGAARQLRGHARRSAGQQRLGRRAASSSPPTGVPSSAWTRTSPARRSLAGRRRSRASSTAATSSARPWPGRDVRWTFSRAPLEHRARRRSRERFPDGRAARS